MFTLFDEDLDGMDIVEGALALNHAINSDTDVVWVKAELANLLSEIELALVNESDEKQKFDSFVRYFYYDLGFKGDSEAYFSSENVFIDTVLKRRKGIPVSLGALFLYFAGKLGFPVEGITFPTQFLVKLAWPDEKVQYINPYNGEYVAKKILTAWLIGQEGPLAKLKPEHLKTADHPTIIGRWLAVTKSALLREERYTLALRCTDLALTFVPDDPYEIRDRGFIYQQLDCHQIAKSDYQFFIDQCPEDPAAELLKSQLRALDSNVITIH
ncbi:SirB1 family protein [Vibrio algarum]|uniref:SirB1 family protein n=1 Tax=Vibrio algarum TaxID=3020714 RepID=A0ABT4YP13_9VIBR|nr:SirB1 family protein [Vibrio sp. KJ40-1]MDB1123243.1 SirB1 family protein [Vibrio sp. KJ40-1]